MNTFYYLLEANAYLIVFYTFFKVLLQKETFYSLNRFYLLVITALSFLLPLIDISAVRDATPMETYTSGVIIPAENAGMDWWQVGLNLYILVVLGLLLRLAIQLHGISKLVKSGKVIIHGRFKEVQIRSKNLSFSFFNYLFINPELQEQNTIRKHELVHINQKHSLDILFIELVQIINWFNPIISLIKIDIKALHEFIADEIVSEDELGTQNYAMFLIQNSYGNIRQDLSNQMFNQSLLKKRIMKLSQKKSRSRDMLKYALLALLIPSMLCISALSFSKSYGIMDLTANYQDRTKTNKSMSQPKTENMKAQPPAVKPVKNKRDSQVPPPPPPVEPAKAQNSKVKKNGQIPPPPPPVEPSKTINIKSKVPPPPPPVEPSQVKSINRPKVENVKFTHPVARPVKNKSNEQAPPPPPAEPKAETFRGDPVKEKTKSETITGDPTKEKGKSVIIIGDPTKEKSKSLIIIGDPI